MTHMCPRSVAESLMNSQNEIENWNESGKQDMDTRLLTSEASNPLSCTAQRQGDCYGRMVLFKIVII